ncbi:hypothetical protein SAMN05421812_109131 [Asanoa hainanensis]|uniref:Uncharacterized protein n=1 Tax=Asanoa hainanensis TaxID=560556 RepID=A0A239NIY8_9ACTN|nr:hypothetical protein [Asanoa hainanensis]SNT54846.1 hypothetical protein SAMN05421812_109131 [Asanoa hainanensis]
MNETQVLVFLLAVSVGAIAIGGVLIARRGGLDAERFEVPVRCRDGHVFTTVWVPGVSLKAIRLGPVRFQWCPVGEHRTFVTLVPWSRLSPEERWMAAHNHDSRVP